MELIRPDDHAGAAGKAGSQFTGSVFPYLTMPSTDGVVINTVTFTPGAHTYWHQHERGQILFVTSGCGIVQSEGADALIIRQGDTIWCPPGERHWHGAMPGTTMTHVAVSLGSTQWAEPVDSEWYETSTANNQ